VAWITAVSVLILLGFFLKVSDEFARGWLLWMVLWGWVFLLGVRLTAMLILRTLRTRGWNHKRLLVVGAGDWGAEVIAKRMRKSWDEISRWDAYDYVLVNDDVDETEARLKTIIEAERLRREQQPALQGIVRNLQAEFEELST